MACYEINPDYSLKVLKHQPVMWNMMLPYQRWPLKIKCHFLWWVERSTILFRIQKHTINVSDYDNLWNFSFTCGVFF